jgi:hypothetical protein
MLGYTKLENLSTQFFMIQKMRHLLLASMHVCMLRLWESRITQTRNACRRCMPLSACGSSGSIMHDGRVSTARRATGWVQPRSESTLEILEANRLSESPTGWQPILRTTNFLSKIVLFGQYWYYFVAVRIAESVPA